MGRVSVPAAAIVTCLLGAACSSDTVPVGASPVIVPDLATIRVGSAQTFVVYNATVRQFTLRSSGRPWNECVIVDGGTASTSTIRIAGIASCQGLLYITADLGSGRSPVVAAATVE